MERYLDKFFSHKLALILPIVLCLIASLSFVAMQPRTYESTGGMWFQSNTIAGDINRSSQDPTPTPAAAATNVFHELIDTRAFCLKVASRGPLASYLSDPRHATQDPLSQASGLVSRVTGKSSSSAQPNRQTLDDSMVYILQHNVTVTASGPHIVRLRMTFPDGNVAAGTLRALLAQFSDEVLTTLRSQQALTKSQLDSRQRELQDAEGAVSRYTAGHPELRTTGAPPDAVLEQLQQAANQARQRYSDAATQYDQMRVQGDTSNFRIIDNPAPPSKPVSWLNSLLFAAVGGGVAGLLLSTVALLLMVLGDRTVANEAELESLGVKSVGSVPLSPADKPRLGWRRRRQRTAPPAAPA